MRNTKKQIPKFKTDAEERSFWKKHDSNEYMDWSKATSPMFANLKPSTKTISLRLPEMMLNKLKLLANEKDVPYQSLLKVFLSQRIDQEIVLHG